MGLILIECFKTFSVLISNMTNTDRYNLRRKLFGILNKFKTVKCKGVLRPKV